MGRFFPVLLLLSGALLGFWIGEDSGESRARRAKKGPESIFPRTSSPSFVFVVYSSNDALWCERSLRSIFEQNYETFRVLFVDDGSSDETASRVQSFVIENQQDHRVILIRNEEKLGKMACLSRAIDQIEDSEIVIPIDARNWMAHSGFLEMLAKVYQNNDVWITSSPILSYPTYKRKKSEISSFYGALFKQVGFTQSLNVLSEALLAMGGKRSISLEEPSYFSNEAHPFSSLETEPHIGSILEFLKRGVSGR